MARLNNQKHELLAKNLIKHNGNQTEAYIDTYPKISPQYAGNRASRTLKAYPEIKARAIEIAESKGFSVDYLIGKLGDLTNAQKKVDGELMPDNQAQFNATKLGLELHGVINGNTNIEKGSTITVNQQFNEVSCEVITHLKEVSQNLAGLRGKLEDNKGRYDNFKTRD